MLTKTIKVETLKCQNCAIRLETILNAVEGFNATVDLETKTAHIEINRDIEDEELKNIIEFGGYTVLEIK